MKAQNIDEDNTVLWCHTNFLNVIKEGKDQLRLILKSFPWTIFILCLRRKIEKGIRFRITLKTILVMEGSDPASLEVGNKKKVISFSSSSLAKGSYLWCRTTILSIFFVSKNSINSKVDLWLPPKESPTKGKSTRTLSCFNRLIK